MLIEKYKEYLGSRRIRLHHEHFELIKYAITRKCSSNSIQKNSYRIQLLKISNKSFDSENLLYVVKARIKLKRV